MNSLAVILILVLFMGCTKKGSDPLNESKSKQEIPTQNSLGASESNCFHHCEAYQKACSNLLNSNLECTKNNNTTNCRQSLKSMFALFSVDIFQGNACKEACWNIGNDNPLIICEKGGGGDYKDLTKTTIDFLLQNTNPMAKALQLSKTIKAMGDPAFIKNYQNKKKTNKAVSPGRIFVVEENGNPDWTDFWLKRHHLSCLGPNVQKIIKQKEKDKESMDKFIDLTDSKTEIFKSCLLNELQIFDGFKTNPIDAKKVRIRYFSSSPANDECFYPVPRLEISFNGKNNGSLFIPRTLNPSSDLPKKQLVNKMNQRSRFFNLDVGEYLDPLESNGKTYLIAPTPGMADCYATFELSEFGPIEISSVCQEPCGS